MTALYNALPVHKHYGHWQISLAWRYPHHRYLVVPYPAGGTGISFLTRKRAVKAAQALPNSTDPTKALGVCKIRIGYEHMNWAWKPETDENNNAPR